MGNNLVKAVLGRTGMEVTRLGYGAMALRDTSNQISETFLEATSFRSPPLLCQSWADYVHSNDTPSRSSSPRPRTKFPLANIGWSTSKSGGGKSKACRIHSGKVYVGSKYL